MIKKYSFEGDVFDNEEDVRRAVFQKSRKVFGQAPVGKEKEFWGKLGVVYEEQEEPLSYFKNIKSMLVKNAFLQWRKDATHFSSLGFKVDSNERSNADVGGLLIVYKDKQQEHITFRDADNNFHFLSYAQLEVLQKEIIENGSYAYQQKWALDAQIEAAESKEALEAIAINFVGKSFS